MSEQKKVPSRLYKFESCKGRSLENLRNQSIYFGSPKTFNDPYDCAMAPTFPPLSDEQTEAFRSALLRGPLNQDISNLFQATPKDQLREHLTLGAQKAINDAAEMFLKFGISCFSESNNDLLMWSHYGDKHRGFCLEFNTAYKPFDKVIKVNYSKEMPRMSANFLLEIEGKDTELMSLCSTKSKSWSYEKEWRVLHKSAETLYAYDPLCLTGIYFGSKISNENIEIICKILHQKNPHIHFWNGRRSLNEFKIEFEKFANTSF